MKTKVIFPIANLAGFIAILACASCSEQNDPEKQARVSKQADVAKQDQEYLVATRSGEIVNVEWSVDLSAYKSAEIMKNNTGEGRGRNRTAKLTPGDKRFKDTLGDAQAYYYWLKLTPPSGPVRNIGPVRVAPDENGVGTYPNIAHYPWSVYRNNTTATISWDFPEANYDHIKVLRAGNPDPITSRNKEVEIISTKEWKQTVVDTLPDPDSDYWYRLVVKIADGPVIGQGPVAANFKKPQ